MLTSSSTPPLPAAFPRVTAALFAAGLISTMGGASAIEVAGELYVDVDATTLSEGVLGEPILNNGTLGGSFKALGRTPATTPYIRSAGGTKGVRFGGTSFLQLADDTDSVIPAPSGLVGLDATATIEVWVLNPSIAAEETMVSWGKRGGPNGTNRSFNYGTDGAWGAVGHWGSPDIGWNNGGGAPAAGKWHHLVYTFDGTTTRVYADGALSNSEVLAPGAINTAANTAINLATQLEGNGVTPTGGLRGSLTLGRVRIHDDVLTPEQVLSNYRAEREAFIDPAPVEVAKLTELPANRYSFSAEPTADAQGAEVTDSLGGAHGIVQGAGASFSGTRLVLPGGGSDASPYADLPNGLVSSRSLNNGGSGQITLEGWIRVTGNRSWSRILDIGSTTSGELTGVGGAGNGGDYILYSAQVGTDAAAHLLEIRNEDPAGGGLVNTTVASPGTFGKDLHYAITWNETSGEVFVYENGKQVSVLDSFIFMSDLNDVNVWLGRSNWTGDQNTQGQYDEFRVYNYVLSPGQILGNFQAGPDTINNGEVAVTVVSSPGDTSIYETYEATLDVSASGSPPISYQWLRNGQPVTGATQPSLKLQGLASENGAKYSCRVSNVAQGATTVKTSTEATITVLPVAEATLVHRYSFGGQSGETDVLDSVGEAHGTAVGGASHTGAGTLALDGVNGYVNLPNDIILPYSDITIETWVQDDGSRGWARIFDFGNSSAGEDFTGAGNGTTYVFLAQPSGLGNLRGAFTITGGGGGEQVVEWPGTAAPRGAMNHIVWQSHSGAHTGRLWVNGQLVGSNTGVTLTPADLGPTANNWLGRANFGADPYFLGSYDEFRIWNGALSPSQIAASLAAGPDSLPGAAGVSLTVSSSPSGVVVSWPASATGWTLESSAQLGEGAAWSNVTEAPVAADGVQTVTLQKAGRSLFFRLKR